MFVTYLLIKFHMPSFSDSINIATKNESWTGPMNLIQPPFRYFAFCKRIMSTGASYFAMLHCHMSFQNPILNDASVAPISQFLTSTMLLLMTLENYKLWHLGSFYCHTILTSFCENQSATSEVEMGGQTHTHTTY